jgi:hypothetical protein
VLFDNLLVGKEEQAAAHLVVLELTPDSDGLWINVTDTERERRLERRHLQPALLE